MTKQYKKAKGDANQIRAYIKRSQELWKHGAEAYRAQDYDAAVILIIHSCISLADAVGIAHSGFRYAGTSHDEAVQYFYDLGIPTDDFKTACRRLGQIVGGKTAAEYGGVNLTAKEAESVYQNGQRFRENILGSLLKKYSS